MRYFTVAAVLSSIAILATTTALNPYQDHHFTPSLSSRDAPDSCEPENSAALNASMQLNYWAQCATNSIFPHPENADWPEGVAEFFSQNIRYTFNNTHYDYDNILKLYTSFNATIGASFKPFKHNITNALAVPNANGDKGGMVYLMGWEGGYLLPAQADVWFSNAAFLLVEEENGVRKIAELRESSNIPNYAPMPPADSWGCTYNGSSY